MGFGFVVESVPGIHTLKMIEMDEVGCKIASSFHNLISLIT